MWPNYLTRTSKICLWMETLLFTNPYEYVSEYGRPTPGIWWSKLCLTESLLLIGDLVTSPIPYGEPLRIQSHPGPKNSSREDTPISHIGRHILPARSKVHILSETPSCWALMMYIYPKCDPTLLNWDYSPSVVHDPVWVHTQRVFPWTARHFVSAHSRSLSSAHMRTVN